MTYIALGIIVLTVIISHAYLLISTILGTQRLEEELALMRRQMCRMNEALQILTGEREPGSCTERHTR